MRSKMYAVLLAVVLLTISFTVRAVGQDTKPAAMSSAGLYRIEFVLSELKDGKQVSSRHYEMLAKEDEMSKLRAGARVPVSTGTSGGYQYLDVGMNIDCRAKESEGRIQLNIIADSSGFSLPQDQKTMPLSQPIIQQLKSQIDTVVSPGKPTLISSMDDPSGNSRFQLEVTATKMK